MIFGCCSREGRAHIPTISKSTRDNFPGVASACRHKKPQPAHFQVLNCWLSAGGCQLAREQACPEPNKHGRVFLFRDPTLKGFPTTSYLLQRLLLLLLLPLLLQLPQPLQPSGTTATPPLLLLLLMSLLLLLLWLPLQLLLLLLLPPLLLLCRIPTPCPYHCYSC